MGPLPPPMIYVLRCGDYVKIGLSRTPAKRLRSLECSNPYPMSLLAQIPGDRDDERALHHHFKHLHHRLEWFRWSDEILENLHTVVAARRSSAITPVVATALDRAIALAGSQKNLAIKAGVSQPAINKAKKRGRASAELAAAIHCAMAPAITKTLLRPDLWPQTAEVG